MSRDRWAEWLLERRHGGDAERRRKQLEFLGRRRDICRELAEDLGATDRCEFVQAALPGLREVADASVDVAMTRSALIYVDDKAGAFGAVHRVLRPGGRLSIFEPINRVATNRQANWLWGVDFTGLEPIVAKVKQAQEATAVSAMLDFDERDLLALAEAAGFGEIHLEYRVDISPASRARATTAWR